MKRLQSKDGVKISVSIWDLHWRGKWRGREAMKKMWWEKNEKCAYPFQDDEEKSRWLFLTLDGLSSNVTQRCLLGKGNQSHWQAVSVCCSIAGKREDKEEKLFFFPPPQKNFSLVTCSYWGAEDRKKFDQLGLLELQMPEKPNPTGLKKGILGPLVEESGAAWPQGFYIQGPSNRCGSFHFSILLSSNITSFLNSTCWYNSCLYLQPSVIPDSSMLVKYLIFL